MSPYIGILIAFIFDSFAYKMFLYRDWANGIVSAESAIHKLQNNKISEDLNRSILVIGRKNNEDLLSYSYLVQKKWKDLSS